MLACVACSGALPFAASAQVSVLAKLPWEIIIGGASLALSLYEHLSGSGPAGAQASPAGQPAVCLLPAIYVGELTSACEQVAWALCANCNGPVVQGGEQGLIPALEGYVSTPSPDGWPRIRAETSRLLIAIDRMLDLALQQNGVLTLVDVTARTRYRTVFMRAVEAIKPWLAELQLAERDPSNAADVTQARKRVLECRYTKRLIR